MAKTNAKSLEQKAKTALPLIASAKTGLTPADNAIMKTLPQSYNGKSVGDVLDYLLQQKGLQDDEIPLAKSVGEEMKAEKFVVVVNGKNAELRDRVADYVVMKEHKLPNTQVRPYNALEIEVSSVQEGGLYRF